MRESWLDCSNQARGDHAYAATYRYRAHAQVAGDHGRAHTLGRGSHAQVAGDHGHAEASGDSAIACVFGRYSLVRARDGGAIVATWMDENDRIRVLVGYPGEDGIEPDTWYRAVRGKWQKAE